MPSPPTLARLQQVKMLRFRNRRTMLCILVMGLPLALVHAQSSSTPAGDPVAWAQAAATNEIAIVNDDGIHPLRYRTRKMDKKGDTTREVIEAREGNVARLVETNGQPLTVAEDAAEKARLQATLAASADFIKHHKRDAVMRSTITDLLRLMPHSMLWTYAPGQPQMPGTPPQIVLGFRPDPNFKPPTIASELLTGIEGRLWVDEQTQHLLRCELHVLRTLDLGWGMLVRVYPGGSIEFEQQGLSNGRWAYSHLVEHLTVREMMFKTEQENDVTTSTDFQALPAQVSYQDAVRQLLAMPVTVK